MSLEQDIRLSLSSLKPAVKHHLLEQFGSAEAIFLASEEQLKSRAELTDKAIARLLDPRWAIKAEEELDFIDRYSIRTLAIGAEEFPHRVAATPDSPTMLFAKGDIDFNQSDKWIAIIGTRKATDEGYDNCIRAVEEIAERYPSAVIVSGLAYGIDITAHRAALRVGLKTVAVVAHGLDRIYPTTHRQWAKQMIAKGGAIVTEFVSGTESLRPYFIQRNRIIAALCDATIVIESAERGGSLVTADIADSYDREVFACPGRLSDKNYTGCNRLIKNSKASLYQDVSDLAYIMDWPREKERPHFNLSLTTIERKIYEQMTDEPITAEELAYKSDQPIYIVLSNLSAMEINGIIKSVKARMYIKLR